MGNTSRKAEEKGPNAPDLIVINNIMINDISYPKTNKLASYIRYRIDADSAPQLPTVSIEAIDRSERITEQGEAFR